MTLYPLTHAQKRICYTESVFVGSPLNNLGGAAIYHGEHDMTALEGALNQLLVKNSVLRMRYLRTGLTHQQWVEEHATEKFERVDFSKEASPQVSLNRWMENASAKPMTFCQSQLYRFVLIKMSENCIGFYINLHHFVADGWTFLKVSEQVSQAYHQLSRSVAPSAAAEIELLDYRTAIEEESVYLSSRRFTKDKNYWTNKYAQLPDLSAYPQGEASQGRRYAVSFTGDQTRQLDQCSELFGCSLNSVVVAMGTLLLALRFQTTDVTIGVPVFNRTSRKTRSMLGMFTSTMASRFALDKSVTVTEYVQYVEQELRQDFRHQKYPYDLLVQELPLAQQNLSRLFHLSVNYYNSRNLETYEDIQISNFEVYNGHQSYDLQLIVKPDPGSNVYQLNVDYKLDCYSDDDAKNMAQQFFTELDFLVNNANAPLSELSLMSAQERDFLVNTFNQRQQDYPKNTSIVELIALQTSKSPNSIAFQFGSSTLSYAELQKVQLVLASEMVAHGIRPGDVVAVVAGPCAELVVALLAILKCGAVYSPIDLTTPDSRVDYMLGHADAKLVLDMSDRSFPSSVSVWALAATIRRLKHLDYESALSKFPQWPRVDPSDPAYIIFTSGSTGNPKGVLVHHRGLVNYISWAVKTYFYDCKDAMALYSSPAFDLTVTSIFCPLVCGARIVVYGESQNGYALFDILNDNVCTVLKLTPSHLNLIKSQNNELSSIHTLILGGEALNSQLAATVSNSFANQVRIFNEYGPTETVVGSMTYLYNATEKAETNVPIGVPIANTAIYLLDDQLQPVCQGMRGEMYIGGDGVTLGYFNSPKLTEKAFLANPYIVGQRIYKTGDVASFNGTVMQYHGRNDDQIKLNGYRIECSEIESRLREYPAIDDAKVVLRKINNRAKQLCAYITGDVHTDEPATFNGQDYLQGFLPQYMIPSYFVTLAAMPLTLNGKVDTKKLPEPVDERAAVRSAITEAESKAADQLLAAAGKILELNNVELDQNFIHLGGDSITAIQLSTYMEDLGYNLSAKSIMSHGAFRAMLNECSVSERVTSVDQEPGTGEVNASPIMLWLLRQQLSNVNKYNQCLTLALNEDVDKEDVESALNFLVAHHDSLRLNFQPATQTFFYNSTLLNQQLSIIEVEGHNVTHDLTPEVTSQIMAPLDDSLNIELGWLMSAGWYRHIDGRQFLTLCAHHFAVDGISWRVIVEQLSHLLVQKSCGKALELPSKTQSFQTWSQGMGDSSQYLDQMSYWQDIVDTEAQSAFGRQNQNDRSVQHTVSLEIKQRRVVEQSVTEALSTVANKSFSTTPQELLLVALSETLSRQSREDVAVIEMESHGRHGNEVELSRTVGWFTALYPVKLGLNFSSRDARIKHTKETVRTIPDNGIGYGVLSELTNQLPISQVRRIRFNYLGNFDQSLSNDMLSVFDFRLNQDAKNQLSYLIDLNLVIKNSQLVIEMSCSEEIMDRRSMDRWIEDYKNSIEDIVAFCVAQSNVSYTPSDFETADLDLEDIDELFG